MKGARIKLLGILKPQMSKRGYRFSTVDDLFLQAEGDFTYQWQCRFTSGSYCVEVEPEMGIRSEIVERIFHQTSTFLPKYQSGTSTIGSSLANIERADLKLYTSVIATDEDLQIAALKLLALFDDKALPFFRHYGNLQAIDHLLNDRPYEHTPLCAYGISRETRGLIVARLVGRSNYSELEAYYRSRILKLNGGFFVTQFEALVSSLAALGKGIGDTHFVRTCAS